MGRFRLKTWRLELPDPFVCQFYYWSQGFAVVANLAHGDFFGATLCGVVAVGAFVVCVMDWTHYG